MNFEIVKLNDGKYVAAKINTYGARNENGSTLLMSCAREDEIAPIFAALESGTTPYYNASFALSEEISKVAAKRAEAEALSKKTSAVYKVGSKFVGCYATSPEPGTWVVYLEGLKDAQTVADALNSGATELPKLQNGYCDGETLVERHLKPKTKLQHREISKQPRLDEGYTQGWHDVTPGICTGRTTGLQLSDNDAYFNLYREVPA